MHVHLQRHQLDPTWLDEGMVGATHWHLTCACLALALKTRVHMLFDHGLFERTFSAFQTKLYL